MAHGGSVLPHPPAPSASPSLSPVSVICHYVAVLLVSAFSLVRLSLSLSLSLFPLSYHLVLAIFLSFLPVSSLGLSLLAPLPLLIRLVRRDRCSLVFVFASLLHSNLYRVLLPSFAAIVSPPAAVARPASRLLSTLFPSFLFARTTVLFSVIARR